MHDTEGQPPLPPREGRAEGVPLQLTQGVAEFNRREFYACHETLEALWIRERGPVRELYQGIIQVGVGFYHLLNGNFVGGVRTVRRGLDRLCPLPAESQGVDVGALVVDADRALRRIVELGSGRLMPFDTTLIPTIRFTRLTDLVHRNGGSMQLETAQRVLNASLAKAREIGVPMSIVVVDDGGHMVTMARMDGARFLTVEIAYGKAYGCIGFHRVGQEVAQFGQNAPAFVSALATASQGKFFAALGSIRVVEGGQEVGAVGVSGGAGEQDHEVAQAGVDAAK